MLTVRCGQRRGVDIGRLEIEGGYTTEETDNKGRLIVDGRASDGVGR